MARFSNCREFAFDMAHLIVPFRAPAGIIKNDCILLGKKLGAMAAALEAAVAGFTSPLTFTFERRVGGVVLVSHISPGGGMLFQASFDESSHHLNRVAVSMPDFGGIPALTPVVNAFRACASVSSMTIRGGRIVVKS